MFFSFFKWTKHVTIATEFRVFFSCQSFSLVLEVPGVYWPWDLMNDTLTFTSFDKRLTSQSNERHWRCEEEEAEEKEDWHSWGGSWLPLRLPFCCCCWIQHRRKNRQETTAADSDSSNCYAKQNPYCTFRESFIINSEGISNLLSSEPCPKPFPLHRTGWLIFWTCR